MIKLNPLPNLKKYFFSGLCFIGALSLGNWSEAKEKTRFELSIEKETDLVVLDKYLTKIEQRIFALENWKQIEFQFNNGVDASTKPEIIPEWNTAKKWYWKYKNLMPSQQDSTDTCSAFQDIDNSIYQDLIQKIDSYLFSKLDAKEHIILESQIEILFELSKNLYYLQRNYRQEISQSDVNQFCLNEQQHQSQQIRNIHFLKTANMLLGIRGVWQVMLRTDQLKMQQIQDLEEMKAALPLFFVGGMVYAIAWEFIITTPLNGLVARSVLSKKAAVAIEIRAGAILPLIGFHSSFDQLLLGNQREFKSGNMIDINYLNKLNEIQHRHSSIPNDVWGLGKIMEELETNLHILKVRNTPKQTLLPSIKVLSQHYGSNHKAAENLKSKRKFLKNRIKGLKGLK